MGEMINVLLYYCFPHANVNINGKKASKGLIGSYSIVKKKYVVHSSNIYSVTIRYIGTVNK